MTGGALTILIVDDHPAIRAGVRALLGLAGDVDVVGEAATGDQAVALVQELAPDIVLMDLRLPGGGIEATRRIMREAPGTAVLVLTMVEDDASIFAAIRAGARGYLRKESSAEELARAIAAVANGEFITSPGIAARLAAFFSNAESVPHTTPFPDLTEREHEVLDLIASGCNNDAIARRLFLSPKTVRNHISNIFAKLHVANRAEVIVRAREAGLGSHGASAAEVDHDRGS